MSSSTEQTENQADVAVVTVEDLRRHYRAPSRIVREKCIDHLDPGARDWIAASPFFTFATASAAGVDVSPRGGHAGFVVTLDEHTLAFPDLSGNNRLDSYTNLVEQPEVGMLFFVPGSDETLRVNGRARVTTDPEVLARCPIDERPARVAVVVHVTECFIHCGKALRRAGMWDVASWRPREERPSAAAVLNEQLHLGLDPADIERGLEDDYRATMWEPG